MSEEIKWEVGQEVWDVIFGKGEVNLIEKDIYTDYPIRVRFETNAIKEGYTKDGKSFKDGKRTLFFSEPIITAAMFPVKK